MKLEQPRIQTGGNLADRVAYLERYLYRLVQELQFVADALEQLKQEQGGT